MGRFFVRLIFASCWGSSSMLKAFADAEQRAVPVVRNTSVTVERLEDTVADERSAAGTGNSEYAVVVVRTIRKESLGFDNARHVVRRRRNEVVGRFVDIVESLEEASGGISVGSAERSVGVVEAAGVGVVGVVLCVEVEFSSTSNLIAGE